MPGVIASANRGSQRLAVRVGSGQSAEIAALAEAHAGHKKGHGMPLRLRPGLLPPCSSFLGENQV